jgi:hypothetical protein
MKDMANARQLKAILLASLLAASFSHPALSASSKDVSSPDQPETKVQISIFDLVKAHVGNKKLQDVALDRQYIESVLAVINQAQNELLACVKPGEKLETHFSLDIESTGHASAKNLLTQDTTTSDCVVKALATPTYPAHHYSGNVELEFPLKISRTRL